MWLQLWRRNRNRSKYVLFDDDDDPTTIDHNNNNNNRDGKINGRDHQQNVYKSKAERLEYFHRYYQSFDSSIDDVHLDIGSLDHFNSLNNSNNNKSSYDQQHSSSSVTQLPAVEILNDNPDDSKTNRFNIIRQQSDKFGQSSPRVTPTLIKANSEKNDLTIFTTSMSVDNHDYRKKQLNHESSLSIMLIEKNKSKLLKNNRKNCLKIMIISLVCSLLLALVFYYFIIKHYLLIKVK